MIGYDDFTQDEYDENLNSLNIEKYEDLIGKIVHYSRTVYGPHIVEKWDSNKKEYLLKIDNNRFWCKPFLIKLIKDAK